TGPTPALPLHRTGFAIDVTEIFWRTIARRKNSGAETRRENKGVCHESRPRSSFLRSCKQKRGRADRPSMSTIRKSGDRFSERSCSTKILERQQCWRSRWVSTPALTGEKQRRRGRPYSSRTRRRTSRLRIAERQRHEVRGVTL